MVQRIQVAELRCSLPYGYYDIVDSWDGTVLMTHSFEVVSQEVNEANRQKADAIAYAMNAAPNGAIQLVRSCGHKVTQAVARYKPDNGLSSVRRFAGMDFTWVKRDHIVASRDEFFSPAA